jgi:hypothetical protein
MVGIKAVAEENKVPVKAVTDVHVEQFLQK